MDQQVVDQQTIEKKPRFRVSDNVVTRFLRNAVKAYFGFLSKLPTWGFIVAVAVWTVVFKTALVPFVALLNAAIFAPLGLDGVVWREPVLELSDALTKTLYSWDLFNWETLSTISQVLVSGLLFPLVATLLAQVIPQHSLATTVRSERRRAIIAVAAMGLLYMICYGRVALLISGSVIAIPLVFTFFHRLKAASLTHAYLITAGIHAIANTFIVLFRGLFGGD